MSHHDYTPPRRPNDVSTRGNRNRVDPDHCAQILSELPPYGALTEGQKGELQVVKLYGSPEQRTAAQARLVSATRRQPFRGWAR